MTGKTLVIPAMPVQESLRDIASRIQTFLPSHMKASETLTGYILSQAETVWEMQRLFTSHPAISPASGGQGEWEKASHLPQFLTNCKLTWFNCPDAAITNPRPNLAAILEGKSQRKLWLFCHLDVVPPGDASLWLSNPWEARREGDWIYGRGVEDNQQALVSMLTLAKSLADLRIQPELSLGLVFLADEENGSNYGLKWLLQNHGEIFDPNDYYIVPDGGSPDATVIEIAEKAQLWLKFTVLGSQCHASTPQAGNNALLAACALIQELNRLNLVYEVINPLFSPPFSTFTPTKHDGNVEAINIVSGKETFYLDCRLLPGLAIDEVLLRCQKVMSGIEALYNVQIEMDLTQSQEATAVSPETPALKPLREAIRKIYNVEARLRGIGGATVASFLRQHSLPAVVWACLENSCHQPNERSSITATLKDAAVFGQLLFPENSLNA